MTYYTTITEAFEGTIREILSEGRFLDSRNGGSFETLGASLTILQPDRLFVTNEIRAMSPSYAAGELLWYLKGSNDGEMISYYAPSYKNYLVDGVAPGAYGPRIMSGLEAVITELKDNPNSRRAFLPIFQPGDLDPRSPDVPCTTGIQFLQREGHLHCVVSMRSNDVWLGLPYDFFCFASIMQLVAFRLDLNIGTYTHNVGSLHLYSKHLEKAVRATNCDSREYYDAGGDNGLNWDWRCYLENQKDLFVEEANCRKGRLCYKSMAFPCDDFYSTILELATGRASQLLGMEAPHPTNCAIATMAVENFNQREQKQ